MSLVTLTFILWTIFFICMIHEPRNFFNALLLIFNLLITMIACAMKPGIFARILGFFIILLPIIFLIFCIFLIINGLVMIKKEGKKIQNLLSLYTGIGMILSCIISIIGIIYFQDESIMRSIFYLFLIIEIYFYVAFASLLIYSLIYTYIPKNVDCDYIIIHGCGLKKGRVVSHILKDRVDKAVMVFNKNKKNCFLVLSGGRGNDEEISEAQAMMNYLVHIKFPKEKIILEDKSTTTYENLLNTRNMLDKNKKNKYIFVTSNYHVFRTSLLTKKLKMKASGVGCNTAFYYFPSAFIREYIAIMFEYKWIIGLIIINYIIIEILIFMV